MLRTCAHAGRKRRPQFSKPLRMRVSQFPLRQQQQQYLLEGLRRGKEHSSQIVAHPCAHGIPVVQDARRQPPLQRPLLLQLQQ